MNHNQYFITNDQNFSLKREEINVKTILSWKIYSHTDLEITVAKSEMCAMILIGFLIDPNTPKNSNQDILNELCNNKESSGIFEHLERLSGKFVLIIQSKNKSTIVCDCFSERQLYYHYLKDCFYGASTEKLLLESLELEFEIDPKKKQLLQSPLFLNIDEHWLLSKSSWDHRILKLLSNHYLNVKTQTVKRIPLFVSNNLDEDQVLKEASSILKNTIEGYRCRYENLLLPLTGGYDSRLLMAASINVKDEIHYYTFERSDTYVRRDVRQARKIANTFKLNYNAHWLEENTKEFLDFFREQFLVPRVLPKTKNVQWFYKRDNDNSLNISGNGGELTRGFYDSHAFSDIDEAMNEIEIESSPIQRISLMEWLQDAQLYCKKYELDVSDLFYHEIRLGNWASLLYQEMDITGIEFSSPFNNKYLNYMILLNIPKAKRIKPSNGFHISLMETLLPNSSDIPFNPLTWKDTLKRVLGYKHFKGAFRALKYKFPT